MKKIIIIMQVLLLIPAAILGMIMIALLRVALFPVQIALKLGAVDLTLPEEPKGVVDLEKLEERDGLMYFEEKPVTDVVVEKYSNGRKLAEYAYKDGKYHGPATYWYENGQKESEHIWKDGKAHGTVTHWDSNGQKLRETTYKDDKYHGLSTLWYSNGQKKRSTNYVNGLMHGTLNEWHENGQMKKYEANYVEGNMVCPMCDAPAREDDERCVNRDCKVVLA